MPPDGNCYPHRDRHRSPHDGLRGNHPPAPTAAGDFWAVVSASPGFQAGFILDPRPEEEFRSRHLAGSVNIPLQVRAADALAEALPSVLLPPRGRPLLIVDDDADRLAMILHDLARRERAEVQGCLMSREWPRTVPAGALAAGTGAPALWRPDTWLLRHADLLPPPVLGPALDLACGSGRAAVWLALRGFAVTGLDHLPDALDLGRRLADRHGVDCSFRAADLRDLTAVPPGPWAVITVFRYLQRDLLAYCRRLLRPGGVILVRTFRDLPGWDGKPARRHRLRGGELPGYFPAPEFTVLAHEESRDPDGRPAAGIVVRRGS